MRMFTWCFVVESGVIFPVGMGVGGGGEGRMPEEVEEDEEFL